MTRVFIIVCMALGVMAMDEPVCDQDCLRDEQVVAQATLELKRRGHNPEEYQHRLFTHQGRVSVIFMDKDVPQNLSVRGDPASVLGNPGAKPGLEVDIDPQSYRVLGSHYIR